MEPRVASQGALPPRPGAPAVAQAQETPSEPVVQTPVAREHEEMRMLLIGFATGLTIAFIFLIYVVVAFSGWLP